MREGLQGHCLVFKVVGLVSKGWNGNTLCSLSIHSVLSPIFSGNLSHMANRQRQWESKAHLPYGVSSPIFDILT